MPGAQTLLRALVTERHWQRFETFETQFMRAAAELAAAEHEPGLAKVTVSRRQFERWYAGRVKTVPHPDSCRVLEHMFGHKVHELLASAAKTQREQAAKAREVEPWRPPISQYCDAAAWALGSEPFRLSEPLLGSVLPEPERMISMAARRALRFSAAADASNVGGHSLDLLRSEAQRLALAYPQRPLSEIIGDIVSLQDITFTLLEGRQRPRETRDLYVLGGLFSGMLAKAAHDLREPYTTMTHARTAMLCARNAENDALTAWIGGLQSLIAYWAGRPREALDYAQSAASGTSGHGSVRVWLAALEARAWAALGNEQESLRAIERAAQLRESIEGDDLDQLGGMCYFSGPRQLYYAADACASLPESVARMPVLRDRARGYATQAVTAYENASASEVSFGDEAGSRTDLAIAHIRAGEIDGAQDAIQPVLTLPAGQRINGVLRSLLNVHRAVTVSAVDAPVALDIQEAIEDYCRMPAPALPQ
jgi:tetratricopeptide (TPR) repeat protein